MAEFVVFTPAAERRISSVVKHVEQQGPPGRPARKRQIPTTPGFWIRLTAEGTGGDVGWYSWQMIYPDPEDPTNWVDADSEIAGTLNARDANNRTDLVLTDPARYFVTFIGFDADGDSIYIFSAGNLPTGQYETQLYQTVGNNVAGWEPPLACPDLHEVEIGEEEE